MNCGLFPTTDAIFTLLFLPSLSTLPIIFPGFPTTSEKAGTSLVTTAPEPMRAYSPIVTPQTIVAFAPMLADFLPTFSNSAVILFEEIQT